MILADNKDILIKKSDQPKNHKLSLLNDIYVEPGSIEDWNLLHELHYKADNLGIGPKYFKCTIHGATIGVGVMTVPRMLGSGRNELFKHLRPNVGGLDTKVINTHRAKWMNSHICLHSRLVLDTIYRGAGIAYRMQNIMMRMTGCKIIEFQSSMSKFNPFALRAGVKFTRPRRASGYKDGLAWFRRWFESIPTDYVGVMKELEQMPEPIRKKCVMEMRKFYYDHSSMEKSGDNRLNGTSRVDGLEVEKLLKNLQQLIFASPLYGVYINPDYGIALPDRLPIIAFDNQPVDAPLNLSALK